MVALLQLCRAAMKFICTRFCYCRFASVSTTEPIRRLPSPFGSGKCAVVASVTSSSLCLIDPPMKLRQLEQFSSLYTIYFALCIPFGRPVRVWRNAWKGFNGPYPKLQFNVAEWLTARRHLCWTTTNNFCLLLFFFLNGGRTINSFYARHTAIFATIPTTTMEQRGAQSGHALFVVHSNITPLGIYFPKRCLCCTIFGVHLGNNIQRYCMYVCVYLRESHWNSSGVRLWMARRIAMCCQANEFWMAEYNNKKTVVERCRQSGEPSSINLYTHTHTHIDLSTSSKSDFNLRSLILSNKQYHDKKTPFAHPHQHSRIPNPSR